MINFGVWQLPDTPFGNAPGGRVPPESRPTSPTSRHICHSFYLYKTVSEVFNLEPTSILIRFPDRLDQCRAGVSRRCKSGGAPPHSKTQARIVRSKGQPPCGGLRCAPPLLALYWRIIRVWADWRLAIK